MAESASKTRETVVVVAMSTPYEEVVPILQDHFDVVVWTPTDPLPSEEICRTVRGLFISGHAGVDTAFLQSFPSVVVVSNYGVGVDHINVRDCAARGIEVGNTPGTVDGATADQTFALLLAAARNVVQADAFTRSSEFTALSLNHYLGQEVHGAVIGIVGCGSIGYQVAKRARGFDMKVIYYNRGKNEKAEKDFGVERCDLPDLLQRADFVTLNCPLTPETRHLIGLRELRLMKPTSVLVNCARGGVVDTSALTTVMQERGIFCAALDVTDPEPLPRDHPLHKLPNVILAPHLGTQTQGTRRKMAQAALANLTVQPLSLLSPLPSCPLASRP